MAGVHTMRRLTRAAEVQRPRRSELPRFNCEKTKTLMANGHYFLFIYFFTDFVPSKTI